MHEELPRRGPGGAIYGFQLWVNLPAKLKMSSPRYQEIRSEDIPVLEKNGARIRIVAGSVGDVPGPVKDISIGPLYIDVPLDSNTTWEQIIPHDHTLRFTFSKAGLNLEWKSLETGELIKAVTMLSLGRRRCAAGENQQGFRG